MRWIFSIVSTFYSYVTQLKQRQYNKYIVHCTVYSSFNITYVTILFISAECSRIEIKFGEKDIKIIHSLKKYPTFCFKSLLKCFELKNKCGPIIKNIYKVTIMFYCTKIISPS